MDRIRREGKEMMDMNRLNDLVMEYKIAKLNWDLIKEQDEDIKRKILAENEFYAEADKASRCGDEPGKRILEPFSDFLMCNEDFDKYLDLLYAEYLKAGIADVRGRGYCPDNAARDLFYRAEKALINYTLEELPADVAGVKIDKAKFRDGIRNIKYKERFLDIIFKLAGIAAA